MIKVKFCGDYFKGEGYIVKDKVTYYCEGYNRDTTRVGFYNEIRVIDMPVEKFHELMLKSNKELNSRNNGRH